MDRSAILERTPNMTSEEALRIAEEEHNRRAEEQFRRLLLENITPETENTRTLEEMYATAQTPSAPAPAPVQAPAASAADRLADYTPAPSQRTELFGNVEFKNGELIYHDVPQVMPAAAPSAQSEQTVDEDVRPTRRTMDTLVHSAAAEETVKPNAFAGLSSGTKTALIVVAAAVLLLIVSICICSSVLGSLSADIASFQAELGDLSMTSQALRSQIGSMTNPDYVDNYARTVLEMIRQ